MSEMTRGQAMQLLAQQLAKLVDSGKWDSSTLANFLKAVEDMSVAQILFWAARFEKELSE